MNPAATKTLALALALGSTGARARMCVFYDPTAVHGAAPAALARVLSYVKARQAEEVAPFAPHRTAPHYIAFALHSHQTCFPSSSHTSMITCALTLKLVGHSTARPVLAWQVRPGVPRARIYCTVGTDELQKNT